MDIKALTPRQALNKAFLRAKPNRIDIDRFKTQLVQLLDRTNDTESEEFHKNLVSDFLKKTYYEPNHFINLKGRNDLVIHNGQKPASLVGVIFETKKPTNKAEMMTTGKLNTKAFQELVLYYLRERVTHKNLEVKHLIATNIYEWFIFDANVFDRLFAQNKPLVKQFEDFEEGRLADIKTSFFYQHIAEPFIAELKSEIEFTYFNLQDYQKLLCNAEKADDKQLIALFKLLSPEHLLKLPFANDSNSLDKGFYTELLHIIGLTEIKSGSKKLIDRNQEAERNTGSLLEDAIIQLDSLDKISRLNNPSQYGNNYQERLYHVALELAITWINRILFLKLLEAQLIGYHKGDKTYTFLNLDKLKNYNDLNSLFFQVLAKNYADRNRDVKQLFEKVPYLNSSLFEPTELEQLTLFIGNLQNSKTLPVFPQTVLKDSRGKKCVGQLNTLEYLFRFLDAYDFGSEGAEEIQEDNKPLVNASVLGLIFEKINGYKDGSFFTPGFITMYMSRETLRKAVVQKFKDYCLQQNLQNGVINSIADIYELIPHRISRKQANEIVNSLKICDPAVGSGHFLVSVLNEIIAIKSELMILEDRNGKSLYLYEITVENDDLVIINEDGDDFKYRYPNNQEIQRVQEALFHEKQTLIENCLFGVDINPNSVKICRLRLWIELLKNAYYKNSTELETLPNIDINIKCGNSLVSRFAIDADLGQALKKNKWSIESYRSAVDSYRNAKNREHKREMERLIADIKSDFRTEISANDPKLIKLQRLKNELFQMQNQVQIFEMSKKEKSDWDKKLQQKTLETEKLAVEIEAIKTNQIFENAFEWRFEFPEVLNDKGHFIGFDVVIGNPPYIPLEAFSLNERNFFNTKYIQLERKYETSVSFILEGLNILSNNGLLSYIAPITWQTGGNYTKFRSHLIANSGIDKIINLPFNIFENAYVDTALYFISKVKQNQYSIFVFDKKANIETLENLNYQMFKISELNPHNYKLFSHSLSKQFERFKNEFFIELGKITKSTQGLSSGNFSECLDDDIETEMIFPFLAKGNVYNFLLVKDKIYKTSLENKKNLVQFYQAEPKILIRRIVSRQDRLSVTYCDEKLVFKKDINPFIPTDSFFDCYYLTGIISSKFISFIYLNSSLIATKDDFRQTTLNELRKLPIPKASKVDQNKIAELVKKILEIKKEDQAVKTLELEKQIDQLVYQLYDLTEEEIKIIEKN